MRLSIRLVALSLMSFLAVSLDAERIYVVYDQSMMWMDAETGAGGMGMGGGVAYDIAVSPDRRTLYHLSGEQLAIRDPQTFQEFRGFEVPHRLRWILPARSSMAFGNRGALLYLLKLYSSPTQEDVAVATFDTVNNRLLPQEAHLSECQGATLIPLRADRQLLAVCGGDSVVHFLTIGSDGSIGSDFVLTIPPLPVKPMFGPRVCRSDYEEAFVQWALTPDGSTLLLAKWDGRMIKIDVASRRVTALASTPPVANTRIMPSAACVSPNGALWYVAARNRTKYDDGNEQILVLDTQTLMLRSTITPGQPFRAMAISPDGQRLYTTERQSGVIHVLNAETGEEIRALGSQRLKGSVHDGPTFLVVTP
jgi:DNA-binding beta-propeller fold protein YncE